MSCCLRKLQQRNAPVQRGLQHEDVHPGLVIAIDQIPVRVAQAGIALHVPGLALDALEPAAVAADPGRGDAVEQRIDAPSDRRERQQQLQQGQGKQQQAPEQRAGDQQQRADRAGQPCQAARHRPGAMPPRGRPGCGCLGGFGRMARAGAGSGRGSGKVMSASEGAPAAGLRRIKPVSGAIGEIKADGIFPRGRPSWPIARAPAPPWTGPRPPAPPVHRSRPVRPGRRDT